MTERNLLQNPELTQPNGAARDRKVSKWVIVLLVASVVVALAAFLPSPYVVQSPGPVVNALGSMQDQDGNDIEIVKIEGAEPTEHDGSINVLSVTLRGSAERPLDWLTVLGGAINPTNTVLPRVQVYPDGMTDADRAEMVKAQMESSQLHATVAALEELDVEYSSELSVDQVSADGPAAGVLKPGDVFITANDVSVLRLGDLQQVLRAAPAGESVTLTVLRADAEVSVSVDPLRSSDSETPLLGITVTSEHEFPLEIDLELDRIGGSSAGLVFAMAIIDKLSDDSITGGLAVSATGTIDDNGNVGAIGGLKQKIWGAHHAGTDVMLMPVENCSDVPDRLPSDMRIVAVETLSEALSTIETVANGAELSGVHGCV